MLQVFLTDLQSYNEGDLVGKWVQLPDEPSKLSQAISEVFSEGESISGSQNHEEYFITDYEWGDIPLFKVEEYSNLFELNSALHALESIEWYPMKAIAFLLDQGFSGDVYDAIEKVDDVIVYENQNMKDIAYSLIEECYSLDNVPSLITSNIDYEGIAKDLELEGNYYRVDNDIYEYIG